MKQVDSTLHSYGKSHMLNIKAFCVRRDGNDIAILNLIFQSPYESLWDVIERSSANSPFNRRHPPKIRPILEPRIEVWMCRHEIDGLSVWLAPNCGCDIPNDTLPLVVITPV